MILTGVLLSIVLIAIADVAMGHWPALGLLYPVAIVAATRSSNLTGQIALAAAIVANAAAMLVALPVGLPVAGELLISSGAMAACLALCQRTASKANLMRSALDHSTDVLTAVDPPTAANDDDADTKGAARQSAESFFKAHLENEGYYPPLPLSSLMKQLEKTPVVPLSVVKQIIERAQTPQTSESLTAYLLRQRLITPYQRKLMLHGNTSSLEIADYWIAEPIGKGAEGVVVRARHKHSGLVYAIKMIESGEDTERLQRIRREMEASNGLVHPNVIVAAETGEANGVCYIVMEWIDGTTLDNLVIEHGPLSLEETMNVILQATRGLRCAHDQGVVHRDVKPGNLMIDQRGKVRVLDLGLARMVANEFDEVGSKHGGIFGTIDYMAPEQAKDFGSTDSRADIYSLGCTMFFLLTGKPRLRGATEQSKILSLIQRRGLRDVRKHLTNYPPSVADLVAKMTAPKAKNRPDTMDQIEQMLFELAEELGMELHADTDMHILLLDDDESHCKQVIERIGQSHHPHSIKRARTLAEAVAMSQRRHFDVALADLNLPDSQGQETISRLRDAYRSLPIVALTASEDNQLGVRCIQAGADDFLPKSQIADGVIERRLLLALNRR